MVEGLGYVFLFRNYQPQNGKWLTADPIGVPDGWNNLAYCNNEVVYAVDYAGTFTFGISYSFSFACIGGPTVSGAIGYNTSSGGIYINASTSGVVGYDVSFSIQGFYSSSEASMGTTSFYDASASVFCVTGSALIDTNTYDSTYSMGITIGSSLVPATPVGGHLGAGIGINTELFNLSDFIYNVFYDIDENTLSFPSIIDNAFSNSIGDNFVRE